MLRLQGTAPDDGQGVELSQHVGFPSAVIAQTQSERLLHICGVGQGLLGQAPGVTHWPAWHTCPAEQQIPPQLGVQAPFTQHCPVEQHTCPQSGACAGSGA